MAKTKKEIKFPRVETKGSKTAREYHAYGVNGDFLGWTNDKDLAMKMSGSNQPNVTALDEVSELSLWLMWNDAIDSKQTVFVKLHDGKFAARFKDVMLVAEEDKHGPSCEMMFLDDFMAQYAEGDIIRGEITKEPMRLE